MRHVDPRRFIGSIIADVAHTHDGAFREKREARKGFDVFVGRDDVGQRHCGLERRQTAFEQQQLALFVFVRLGGFLECRPDALDPRRDRIQIGEDQLIPDRLEIGLWVNTVSIRRNGGILEVPYDGNQEIHLADYGQESPPLLLPLAAVHRHAGHIDEFDRRLDHFLGVVQLGQIVEATVGHFDNAVAGRRLCVGIRLLAGNRGEQRRFSGLW